MSDYEVIAVDGEGHVLFCSDVPDAERTIRNEAYEADGTIFVDWTIYKVPAELANTEAVHLCEVLPDGHDLDDYWVKDVYTADPPEPDCKEGGRHEWTATVEREGGLKENPGVFGHGGGVIINDHCAKCDMERVKDTWATHPGNGSDGYQTIQYIPADED